MSPLLMNIMAGAVLLLIGWTVAFGIYVIRQDRERERENHALRLEMATMRAEFVAKSAWDEYIRNFETWKEKVIEKLGHLGEGIAGIKAQGG